MTHTNTHTQQELDQLTPIDNNHLSSTVSLKRWQVLGPWYIENRFTFPVRKLVTSSRFFFRLISIVFNRFRAQILQTREFLDRFEASRNRLFNPNDTGYSIDSSFGYSGDVFFRELETAHKYKKQIDEGFKGPSESKKLYEHIIDTSTILLNSRNIPSYFNFGVSYAYTDSVLASKFPSIDFWGLERTDAAKIFNDRLFSNLTNLRILFGDVFDLFAKQRFDGGVFFHSRTLLLLPNEFVRRLYSAAFSAGFKYVFGTEQYGISRQTMKSYEFSYDPRDTVVYRDFMYIHNYPNLLLESGFKLRKIESIKTDHPHQDCRILSFIAEADKR